MAIASVITPRPSSDLRTFVEKQSGQKVLDCYQCGKCSAGCPVAYAMDLTPRQVIRGVQLGLKDEVLDSNAIWLCVFCQTCSARCPRQIDIAGVIESLRLLAIAEDRKPAEKDVQLFHRIFLGLVERQGRVQELALGALYNLQGRHPFANFALLPQMLTKRKLEIMPHRVKGTSEVKRLFSKVREAEKQ